MSLHPDVASMLAALDAGFPDVTTVPPPELRALIRERRAPLQRQPDMHEVHEVVIDGRGGDLALRVYRPHHDDPELPVVVFAHGGGFVFCDLDSHDEFCRAMAEGVGVVVASVDYRLAPEHPAPAAHDDVYAALEWMAKNAASYGGDPSRIVLAGDSAGGNLAATVAIAARDQAGPAVIGQALFYPVIDDDFETESYRKFGSGYYNTTRAMMWYWKQYAPHGTDDVRLVPTRAATLADLPPAVVVTAELDPPCYSGDAYAQRLAADGVPVRHRRFAGLFHGFLTIPSLSLTGPARQEIWTMMRGMLS
ncbi:MULTISPECIES: alpha/beta hydrolase [unclassified Rhodococcus (in: high G+C Gram-positive bacteria)]|uniref:alpha/beta hydrolase n=1 Tax=unclassified Rhodococcus (in: high G+C Gram-positive bacteria) TaxID=192944 RepID=UPI00092A3244|nr:alpha/beta hydrolase [Rhodococcus sp. M8]OLL18720.1 esterase [Rhodococcus sp. M8]QPG47405.1 alpha/beta hydrolase [Rhodococcus sp. M8]